MKLEYFIYWLPGIDMYKSQYFWVTTQHTVPYRSQSRLLKKTRNFKHVMLQFSNYTLKINSKKRNINMGAPPHCVKHPQFCHHISLNKIIIYYNKVVISNLLLYHLKLVTLSWSYQSNWLKQTLYTTLQTTSNDKTFNDVGD